MTNFSPQTPSFAYQAQTPEGATITGTLDAADESAARSQLESLRLRVLQLSAARLLSTRRQLSSEDFAAFNQQLAFLAASGLPVEHGLHLIAQEMRQGALRRTVAAVVGELDRGQSLPQAIERHRQSFPPLYARLIDAGVTSGNLPAILLNLGRHLSLIRRLQNILWQTFAYPLVLLLTFCVVLGFIALRVVPEFQDIYRGFHMQLPGATLALFAFVNFLRANLIAICIVFLLPALLLAWIIIPFGPGRTAAGNLALRLPLFSVLLRRSIIARWCDILAISVDAGLDLPAALELAEQSIVSRPVSVDTRLIIDAISAARPLSQVQNLQIIPPTVATAIELASDQGNLAEALHTLAQMYQQQAEMRLGTLQATMAPFLLLAIGLIVGGLMIMLMLPIIDLIEMVAGPMH